MGKRCLDSDYFRELLVSLTERPQCLVRGKTLGFGSRWGIRDTHRNQTRKGNREQIMQVVMA